MNRRLRPDYLDPFIEVARLICRDDPPSWLSAVALALGRGVCEDQRQALLSLARRRP